MNHLRPVHPALLRAMEILFEYGLEMANVEVRDGVMVEKILENHCGGGGENTPKDGKDREYPEEHGFPS